MSKRGLVALAAALCLTASAVVRAEDFDAVEAFGSLPMVYGAALSPDGKRVAVIQPVGDREGVVVYNLADPSQPRKVFPAPDVAVRDALWTSDDNLIAIVTNARRASYDAANIVRPWTRAIALPLKEGEDYRALGTTAIFQYTVSTSIVGWNNADPDYVYMVSYRERMGQTIDPTVSETRLYPYLMKISVKTGSSESIERGTLQTWDWVMDSHGRILARIDVNRDREQEVYSYASGKPTLVATLSAANDGYNGDIVGPTNDGKLLAVLTVKDDRTILSAIDLATGQMSELYANPEYDVDDVVRDEWTQDIIGVRYDANYVIFDPMRAAVQKALEQAYEGETIRILSVDAKKETYVYLMHGLGHPPTVHVYNLKTTKTRQIAAYYPALAAIPLGSVRDYHYEARDGLAIESYLTVPAGKDLKNLPLVVLPHGGPHARDYNSFNWWPQFLAYRGYLVFQPNFRGSTGYGASFEAAGFKEWGGKMQDDVTDGVKKLIADGIVDPKRVCIVGASYGGYAALAGAVFTPDLYTCAASVAGVSDLPQMLTEEAKQYRKEVVQEEEERVGSLREDGDLLRERSPAMHADRVKIPVLLIHGDKDTVVSFAQSTRMNAALRQAGKNVQLVTLTDDDHNLSQASTRQQMLMALDAFLAEHLGK